MFVKAVSRVNLSLNILLYCLDLLPWANFFFSLKTGERQVCVCV